MIEETVWKEELEEIECFNNILTNVVKKVNTMTDIIRSIAIYTIESFVNFSLNNNNEP